MTKPKAISPKPILLRDLPEAPEFQKDPLPGHTREVHDVGAPGQFPDAKIVVDKSPTGEAQVALRIEEKANKTERQRGKRQKYLKVGTYRLDAGAKRAAKALEEILNQVVAVLQDLQGAPTAQVH